MYEIVQTETFSTWLHGLKDNQVKARVERAGRGNFGDWSPEGGKIRAMRIDYGPGYRLYYTIRNSQIIFLLCGGDKRTQESDIKYARTLEKEIL